jgi:hypothetical protein
MKDLVIKILTEESKKLITESGIRDINRIAKRYPMAKIYFHQDLDGVATALAMKNYLEQNGIKVVDAEIIQYGSKEFAVKKPEGEGDIMPVLVDFAHGKPMFVIHTDHHDTQAGVEQGTSTSFKSSRSNVETISQSISPQDIFTQDDIETISMIDSADYAKYDISPEQVIQYLFKIDRTKGVKENKKMMGLVANKLLLAFKNKPDFLRNLVMNAKPSLQNILLKIKDEMEKEGYAPIEQLIKNQEGYIKSRKEKGVTYEDGIISQYGLGPTMKSGGYDRYTPFVNHPDAEFLVTGLPMGMVQASCNPYKKERALKGVDLGQIKDEVLEKFRPELEKQRVTFGTLKRISEMDANEKSVGFTFKDFMAIYGNSPSLTIYGTEKLEKYLDYKSKALFKSIPVEDRKVFNKTSVNGYDVIMANSGGHKCITNISGINYLYSNSKFQDENKRVRGSYVELLKDIQSEFVRVLKEKIKESKIENTDYSLSENVFYVKKREIVENTENETSDSEPVTDVSNNDDETEKNTKTTGLLGYDVKNMFSSWRKKLGQLTGGTSDDTSSTSSTDKTSTTDKSDEELTNSSGGDDFLDVTKKVIDKFEGGYWNRDRKDPESEKCMNHPYQAMYDNSGETMFGLDRRAGNIENLSPEGKEFFKIIDDEKKKLGMDTFCKKWTWGYLGGDLNGKLKDLAAKIMKQQYEKNMASFVKNPETKKKIESNRGLMLHMSYATWNGPGFFKKFAKALEDGVNKGASTKELIDIAKQSRTKNIGGAWAKGTVKVNSEIDKESGII